MAGEDNSNRSIEQAQPDGFCQTCNGRGQLISTFAGGPPIVSCPDCH